MYKLKRSIKKELPKKSEINRNTVYPGPCENRSYALTKKNSSASPGNQPYLKMITILTKTWTAIVSNLDERNTRTRTRLSGYAKEKSDFFGALLASRVLRVSLSLSRANIF